MRSVSILIQIQLIANLRDCYSNIIINFEADFDKFDRNQRENNKKITGPANSKCKFLLNHTSKIYK